MTRREQRAIKRFYAADFHRMRVRPDDTVEAQKVRGGAWGVLYTPRQTHAHLVGVGLRKE